MPRFDFVFSNILACVFIIINFVFFNMSMVNKFITMLIILIMLAAYTYIFILKPRRKEIGHNYYQLFMSVYLYLIAYSLVQVLVNPGTIKLVIITSLALVWLAYVIYLIVNAKKTKKLTW